MLKVLNYFTKTMAINTILVRYFTTLRKSTQLLTRGKWGLLMWWQNIGNVIRIGVSPQLTVQSDPKHNDRTGKIGKHGDEAT